MIMTAESKKTRNHEEIRKWAEARGGKPATVKRTGNTDEPGILRIDFPGGSGEESLEEISWDQFFEKFEEKKLAFLYQEKTKDGKQSRFCKLVSRS
jgi:hypothetical protein